MNEKKNENIDSVTHFGVTDYRNTKQPFGIKDKDRSGHIYVVGKTGVGKSTLIANMVISDIKKGKGIGLIDPHGDLSEEILNHIPKERISDVIYFNAGDLNFPVAYNPLGNVHPDHHHLLVSGLISTFKKIWFEFWGPRLEHILRNTLFTLLENPRSTLLDIPVILTDKGFRDKVVGRLTNPYIKAFWQSEFDKYSPWLQSEAVAPILNKIGQFLSSAPLRNIVGQESRSFRISSIMDDGKIFIANLSKGKIGEDNTALLGGMFVTTLQLAALRRADQAEHERKPFYLYVDEFSSFANLSFGDILSEARKYGLSLLLAHQYIGQLHEKIRTAVFGNTGTIISFRVGAEDAEYLSQEFKPVFGTQDLANLPNHSIYLKLMIDGATSKPFSAMTLPLPERGASFKEDVIRFSRMQYARDKDEVEDYLKKRNERN